MSWNMENIKAKIKQEVEFRFDNSLYKELLEYIIELKSAMYPFMMTLGALDDNMSGNFQCTYINSKLFPTLDGEGKFQVFTNSGELEIINKPKENELHTVNYLTEESLFLKAGHELSDEFMVLSVHQTDVGSTIYCGSIVMEDVRRLCKLVGR